MKTDLSKEDRKLIQLILEKSRFVEKELQKDLNDRDPTFSQFLEEFIHCFRGFLESPDPLVNRQAQLAHHLHAKMSLRHFLNFLIPLERLVDRSLTDPDFFVTTQDQKKQSNSTNPLTIVLDNLRSAFNVGAIFRTAETLNAQQILICGYTPDPESIAVQKTAMGTEKLVKWERFENVTKALQTLQSQQIKIVGLETTPQAISLFKKPLPGTCAFVFGNERFGLDQETLLLCDEVRTIPLLGTKNSLNVASAMAIASFEWHRQNLGNS